MNILEKVKQGTWLFTDEQIFNKILDMKTHPDNYNDNGTDGEYIILYLYKDKNSLTKEEYKSEILNYINYWSRDSKEKINEVLKKWEKEFYNDYNDALQNKTTFYHAVQTRRNIIMSFLNYKHIEDSLLFNNNFDEIDNLFND